MLPTLAASLFDTSDFMPRWACGHWSQTHGWVHIASDLAIFGAYAAIPISILYFVRKRQDVPLNHVFWLFAAFIFACGFGHLVEATLFWHPWYRFSAASKVFTAIASWATVLVLFRQIPVALALPGVARLNDRLREEIAQRTDRENSLRASEERFRLVVEAAPNAMIMVDRRGRITLVNSQTERLFNYTRDELLGQGIEILVPERFRSKHPDFRTGFFAHPQTRPMGAGRDLFGLRKDGSEVPIEIGLNPIHSPEGVFVLASIIDITERKRAEEAMRASLLEKETLLKEIHHRVKNNLQVISSILNLQSGFLHDPRDRAMFDECQQRVRGMAMIHERLYRTQNLASLDFGDHLRQLVRAAMQSYGRDGIRLTTPIDPVQLDLDTAIPLGLIVNELVANALKHAFTGRAGGTLEIGLRSGAQGELTLSVADDGPGMPPDFDVQRSRSLGMKLIHTLARQIRGRLTIETNGGTRVCVTLDRTSPLQPEPTPA